MATKEVETVVSKVVEKDMTTALKSNSTSTLLCSMLVWPGIIALPLVLTYNDNYKNVFNRAWYDESVNEYIDTKANGIKPLGLTLGLLAVVVGQIFMLFYFIIKKYLTVNIDIQRTGAREYNLMEGVRTHLAQPEGFIMLGGYLIGTWMAGLMPTSYYSFQGGINVKHVVMQLLLQDFIQYIMHRLEHVGKGLIYEVTHKPHHHFTNPRIFDAFNGSIADTFCMILIPLFITKEIVHCNVWSYMAFGSLYANWLTLIHAEFTHPWDRYFRYIGFGTAGDHHVHHKLFKYNFGHLFMYWDILFQTYKSPTKVSVFNNEYI
jgi:sterol desaturase/sphingolipid hydroxylase (fatty acid hydroxylase superfamily)